MSEHFEPSLTEIDCSKISSCSRAIIDGDDGCRKTSVIAPAIAEKIKGKVVSIDKFMFEPGHPDWEAGRPYWDQLDYQRLRYEIKEAGAKLVIEGVCGLKVLSKLNFQFDYHIFTRCINRDNTFNKWEYEQYLDEKVPLPKSRFRRYMTVYYREFRPFESCDLMIERHILPRSG
jgi:hypothetical protein